MKNKKLVLKKEIIANLSNEDMIGIRGGLISSNQDVLCEQPDDAPGWGTPGGGGGGGTAPETGSFAGCPTAVGNCQYSVENCASPSKGFGCVANTMGC